ncbi:hypothetical protein NF681_02370 (plasmid) [Comamonadaceae bacterium OTU4NAUVB1]|jgi:predicted DNA-binding protein|nr:hypothetical protein NF681_02370 [Comamonadaceae bacterium OTU4NAUVB1]
MVTISIQLSDELFGRLQDIAAQTGLSSDFYLNEILGQQIGNLERQYAVAQLMPDMPAGRSLAYTLDDVERELGPVREILPGDAQGLIRC